MLLLTTALTVVATKAEKTNSHDEQDGNYVVKYEKDDVAENVIDEE
jgi:hypothetical protein